MNYHNAYSARLSQGERANRKQTNNASHFYQASHIDNNKEYFLYLFHCWTLELWYDMYWNFNHCVNFEVFVLVIQSHLSDQENQSRLFGAWRTSSFPSLSYFNCADRFTLCEDAHCWKALVPAFQPRKPNPSWLMATLPFINININTTGEGKDKMVFSSESRFFLFLTVTPLKRRSVCITSFPRVLALVLFSLSSRAHLWMPVKAY